MASEPARTRRAVPRAVAAATAAMLLAFATGCQTTGEARRTIAETADRAGRGAEAAGHAANPVTDDTATDSDEVWLGDAAIRTDHGDPLPARFEGANGIVLRSAKRLNLNEIAAEIAQITAIPVRIADLDPPGAAAATAPPAASAASAAPAAVPAPTSASPFVAAVIAAANRNTGGTADAADPANAPLDYVGPLSGLLGSVAARYGVSWEYRAGGIRLFRYETRTFTVFALPGDSAMLASVDTGAGNGAAGGNGGGASGGASSQVGVSAQKIQNTAAIRIWQDLKEALEGMVGHAGTISASPATGTVTVTATADVMRTVQTYLREQNQRLSRQVMVSVKVLSVNLADSEQYGLDLSLVFQRLQSGFTANLLGPVPSLAQGFGSLNLGIVNAPPSSPLAKFNGSRAIIEALSTQGDVSAVYSNAVTTSNNKPAPFQNVNQKGYVYSSQTTQTANVGSQTSLTPGTIVTGFSLNVLPRILAANKLLLQFDLAISSLNRLDSVTVGGSFIQLPDIDTRSTLQEVALQSGATLVVTGFEQAGAQTQSSGMGSPDNILLGGQKTGSRSRQAFVVLITPEIVASPFDVAAAPARRDEAP